ncbi:MAG: aspartate aminotransferase family protein [Myxococcota bacterium]
MTLGDELPDVRRPLPGRVGDAWVERLAASECPALTTRRKRRAERTGANHDPIVWVEASGSNVVDADANRYVDLTSGFGVAFVGHGHPKVVDAVREQAGKLIHALGDLHPSDVKIELLEKLCSLSPFEHARAMLSLSGSDAITAALKTAVLATGRQRVIAFEGSYHGLAYGPLAVSGYAERFAQPFLGQLGQRAHFAKWPRRPNDVAAALDSLPSDWAEFGAIVVEPIQGRGGVRIPPPGFLGALRERCAKHGVVVIADEILSGLGRCGAWWRSIEDGFEPDLVCVGKSLGGGLPVSACIGTEPIMRAWGDPDREAIHTGTFFGDPLGAAAAITVIDIIETEGLIDRSRVRGEWFGDALRSAKLEGVTEVRQAGMMIGLQLERELAALTVTRSLLERGYLVLPAGARGNVVQLTPPVGLTDAQFDGFREALIESLGNSEEGRQ